MRIPLRSLMLAWLLVLVMPAHAQQLVSEQWHGELATPGGKLLLLVRLHRDTAGSIGGDIESVSQAPGQKMPLDAVTATAEQLSFGIPAIGARFAATWDARQDAWVGEFRQGRNLPLTLKRGAPPAADVIQGLDGQWHATLRRDGRDLRLVLHIATGAMGTRITLDSPDLGAFGLPVEALTRAGDQVRFRVPSAGTEFSGTLDSAAGSLRGGWSRSGQAAVDVDFRRAAAKTSQYKRSQWPLEAAPYRSQEVVMPNPRANEVVLAGTLTLPPGPGPFPAVVLISGSGAQDRDETMFGHKPFAVLADYLSRRGIAVLRYDDRGFGASSGNFEKATSADFAQDANAAFAYLRVRPEIDPRTIGFAGHSEGGMVGPIAAAENPALAFLILLAGPGTDTDRLILSQRRAAGLAQGVSAQAIDRAEPVVRTILRAVKTAPAGDDLHARLRSLLSHDAMQALGVAESQREAVVEHFASPWMRYFVAYRPADELRRLRLPVLALGGSLDTQVPAAENLGAIRQALAANDQATVVELAGLNHMFQHARSGTIGEIADIEETFAPDVMAMIADWIAGQRGPKEG